MKTWQEVTQNPEYQTLPFADREKAKAQYFNDVVRPNVPEKHVGLANEQFFSDARKHDIEKDEPFFIRDVVGKSLLELPSRVAGVGLGVVNSPLAFIWGSQRAQYDDPEQWKKASFLKKQLIATGAGFESAWRGAFKKGDWGTLYGEYYKSVRGGKTIEDDLPEGLKWTAPTLEFLANVVSDPVIVFGEASRIAKLKIPKGWIGKLPEGVVSDLNKIESLEKVQKTQLQQRLIRALKNRTDYMKWWDDAVKHIEKEIPGYKAGPEVLGKGFVESVPGLKRKVPLTAREKFLSGMGTSEVAGAVDTPSRLASQEAIKQFGLRGEEAVIGLKGKALPIKGRTTQDILRHRPEGELLRGEGIDLATAAERVGGGVKREAPSITVEKPISGKALDVFRPEKRVTTPKKVGPAEEAATVFQKAIEEGKTFKGKKGLAEQLASEEDFLAKAARRLGGKPSTVRATGGLILGVEEDEQGNFRYDVGKGLAGALGVTVGLSKAQKLKGIVTRGKTKFTKTLAQNPAWAKVHGMIGIGKEKRSFSIAGLWAKFDTAILDRFKPLKKISPKTYDEAMVFSAHKDLAKIKFDELKGIFKPVKDDEVLMSDYINAHRAYTRAARGLKNPNGVTLADAKQAIKEIEKIYIVSGNDVKTLKTAFNGFQKWANKHILQEARDSGIISKKAYDDIIKNNKFYATFDVLDHLPPDIHNIPSLPSKEYFSVANQKVIQKMVGTERKIANPIEATVRKFAQAQTTFARNRVASTFVDDPVAKTLMRPIATSKKEFAILKNKGLNPVMEGQWLKKDFDTISRFKDGNVEKYLAPKEFADTMKQLTPRQAPKAVQAINAVFRASATTVYLPFTISNAMRDALMAYTTAPVYKTKNLPKFAKDWVKGFWEGAKHEFLGKSKLTKEYIKHGGGFGYVGNLRKAKLAKAGLFKKGIIRTAGDIVVSPLKLIEKISATVELAPRLGTFQRAKMTGVPSKDAALMAKASTINFNKGGTLTKVVNQWVPFLNARVQSRLTVASALKRDPKGTLSKAFVATVVPGMATYAWNRLYHSDLYDDIPEYIRQNYFCIITGASEDKKGKIVPQYIVIAKGDLGQMTWNPLEYMVDTMWKKDRETTAGFLVNYLSDLSPVEFAREGKVSPSKAAGGLLPPIVKGFAEDWANLNLYRGSEIVPYYMGKTKPPELQYKENTPETYKWLGKELDIAPLRLQNFAGNLLAGYGREGLDPSAMIRGLTGRLMRTHGGAKEQKTWTIIKDIEQGYLYTKAYADEMVKSGDRKGASKLLNQWNQGLDTRIDKIEKFGFKDKGGLNRAYRFTPKKRKTIFLRKSDKKSALEKRLSRRAR